MPHSVKGFLMAAITTLVVIAIATRVSAIAKIAGLPPAPTV